MKKLDQVKIWKQIENLLSKVTDDDVRLAMREQFRQKALTDWGWCPGDTPGTDPDLQPVLDNWEQEFLRRVKMSQVLGVMVEPESHKKTMSDAKISMMKYIRDGGKLEDIPDNIRSPEITKLYTECLLEYGHDVELLAESVLIKGNHTPYMP